MEKIRIESYNVRQWKYKSVKTVTCTKQSWKCNILLICACGSLKRSISHFSEKAFLNGHKQVKYMHVHVIINDKNEKILKNVIHSQAGGRWLWL